VVWLYYKSSIISNILSHIPNACAIVFFDRAKSSILYVSLSDASENSASGSIFFRSLYGSDVYVDVIIHFSLLSHTTSQNTLLFLLIQSDMIVPLTISVCGSLGANHSICFLISSTQSNSNLAIISDSFTLNRFHLTTHDCLSNHIHNSSVENINLSGFFIPPHRVVVSTLSGNIKSTTASSHDLETMMSPFARDLIIFLLSLVMVISFSGVYKE